MELLHASPAPYLLTSVMLQEGLRDKGEVVSSTTTGTSTKPVLGSGYGSGDESDGTASTATLFEEEGADTDFDLDMYRCRAGSDPYPLRQPIGGPITPISAARGSKVFEFNFETRPLPALPINELAGVQLAAVGKRHIAEVGRAQARLGIRGGLAFEVVELAADVDEIAKPVQLDAAADTRRAELARAESQLQHAVGRPRANFVP